MGYFVLVLAMVMTQALPGSARGSWATVLTGFDLIRSQAFQDAKPELLDRVYPRGSDLLDADRRVIISYAERGIEIDDVRMEVSSARLINRTPIRIRLDVVDRLVLTRVHLPDGSLRDLPRDQPTRRVIELALTPDGWRISAVLADPARVSSGRR